MAAHRRPLPLLLLPLLLAPVAATPPSAAPAPAAAAAADAAGYRADALSIEGLVNRHYAYLDRFPGGAMPMSDTLRREAAAVADRRALLRYAERALLALADHHAITGASFADSFAVVPSYSDLWIVRSADEFVVEAVRAGSPAAGAGVRAGDRLRSVEGVATAAAVAAFWRDLGLPLTEERAAFAARVLAAGRRNAPRRLGIERGGILRALTLPNLYSVALADRPLLDVRRDGRDLVIRFNDSLGHDATIAAFDGAMARARPGQRVVLDLTDTPSGGNTVVARGVLGWFVSKPTFYQAHSLPEEERRTGIARRWVEQVLPRPGKRHRGPVEVRVGRWTGSMGEGLALGFHALGAPVRGDRMAGLLGAIYDFRLPHSGLVLKLPAERLYAVDGTPREAFVPRREDRSGRAER
jgi:carboxyl-terminal processing protease